MLDNVLTRFQKVLTDVTGLTNRATLRIDTGDHPPVCKHPYCTPLHWRQGTEAEIDKILKWDVIKPSQSPWSLLILPVSKKIGVHICVDFSALNAITKGFDYPLP